METGLNSVSVYCSSSNKVDPKFKNVAFNFGEILARENIRLVYGGGQMGMMGTLANGCMQAGGKVVGIITDHLHKYEIGHEGVEELIVAPDMQARKSMMFERSDGVVVLPGGFGTLEETFEVLTWKQIALHDKPIVVVNTDGFWNPLKGLVDHIIKNRFASPQDAELVYFVDFIEEVIPLMRTMPRLKIDPLVKWA
jgi:uncharacterized protein (TIGR00730 family)